jgi:2-oxoglutarate ferredoxin oxidoreductase subunit beta
MGSLDHPFNPVSLALGAEATFVARTVDSDRKHLTEVLRAAAAHRGTALVEIYQNCPIFNDGAFDALKGARSDTGDAANAIIPLRHGEPIRFGTPGADGLGSRGVVRAPGGGVAVVEVDADNEADLVVHDAHADDPTLAFALSRITDGGYLHQAPIGIFRQVERTTYDDAARQQVGLETRAVDDRDAALQELLSGGDTWTVV